MNVDIQKEGFVDIELKEGKKITLSEVDMDGRLLSCKGSQIVLYIRDHGDDVQAALEDGSQGRRFHVTFCRTLKEMRRDGLELYVATSDFSGKFHIIGTDQESGIPIEGKTDLDPCQNCLVELVLKRSTDEIFRHFLIYRGRPNSPYSRSRTNFKHLELNPSLKMLLRRWV